MSPEMLRISLWPALFGWICAHCGILFWEPYIFGRRTGEAHFSGGGRMEKGAIPQEKTDAPKEFRPFPL